MPPPSTCWHYRRVSPYLVCVVLETNPGSCTNLAKFYQLSHAPTPPAHLSIVIQRKKEGAMTCCLKSLEPTLFLICSLAEARQPLLCYWFPAFGLRLFPLGIFFFFSLQTGLCTTYQGGSITLFQLLFDMFAARRCVQVLTLLCLGGSGDLFISLCPGSTCGCLGTPCGQ